MKKYIIPVIIILAALGVGLVLNRIGQSEPSDVETRGGSDLEKLADLQFTDYRGQKIKLSDFQDKPLVINSWAVWCPFCVKELEDFVAAQKEFGDQVVIIAIDRQESLSTAKEFTDRLGITHDLVFLLDPGDTFYRAINGFSMPETIFVDKDGNIVDHKRGPMDLDEIRQRIQKIID